MKDMHVALIALPQLSLVNKDHSQGKSGRTGAMCMISGCTKVHEACDRGSWKQYWGEALKGNNTGQAFEIEKDTPSYSA